MGEQITLANQVCTRTKNDYQRMCMQCSLKVSQGSDIVPDTLILSLKNGDCGSEVICRSCRAQRPHCFLLASRRLECWAGLWVTFTAPHTLSDNYIAEVGGNIAGGLSNASDAARRPTDPLLLCQCTCSESDTSFA